MNLREYLKKRRVYPVAIKKYGVCSICWKKRSKPKFINCDCLMSENNSIAVIR